MSTRSGRSYKASETSNGDSTSTSDSVWDTSVNRTEAASTTMSQLLVEQQQKAREQYQRVQEQWAGRGTAGGDGSVPGRDAGCLNERWRGYGMTQAAKTDAPKAR